MGLKAAGGQGSRHVEGEGLQKDSTQAASNPGGLTDASCVAPVNESEVTCRGHREPSVPSAS